MRAAGFEPEDYEHEAVEVWPENWQAYRLLSEIQTQLRVGGFGVVGLDYNVLFKKMDRMNLNPEEYDQLESDVRTMELAALSVINAKT